MIFFHEIVTAFAGFSTCLPAPELKNDKGTTKTARNQQENLMEYLVAAFWVTIRIGITFPMETLIFALWSVGEPGAIVNVLYGRVESSGNAAGERNVLAGLVSLHAARSVEFKHSAQHETTA
jgi:hypothetical protein